MARYNTSNLVRYEEAIQLHYDSTGTTAWLTLRNYGWVFGVVPADAVKSVTIGVSAERGRWEKDSEAIQFVQGIGFRLDPVEFKPLGRPISISAMLDAIDIIRFQVAILEINDETRSTRGFLRKDLLMAIVRASAGLECRPKGSDISFIPEGKVEGFRASDTVGLRKYLTGSSFPTDIERAIREYNLENFGLVAYLPQPQFILQEQRTELSGDSGKTKRQDTRLINPLPTPSDVPIAPMFIDDFERSESSRFEYDDFIKLIDLDYQKKNIRGELGEDKDPYHNPLGTLKRDKSPPHVGYLHKHLQRISCFGFRGDTRDPGEIKKAGGFLPGFTRNDPGVENFGPIAEEIDAALKKGGAEFLATIMKHHILHLGVFTAIEDFKGYISTTTSTAMAKCFASLYAKKVNFTTYCYALRCRGGFNLPTNVEERVDFERWQHAQHRFIHFAEQEVAVPGAIFWDNDVVGVRVIRCDEHGQYFFGPVFLKDYLKRNDNGAFSALFELLSGKSQGEGFMIFNSYSTPPFDKSPPFQVRPVTRPASCDPDPRPAAMRIHPARLDFGSQPEGISSAFQVVTLFNESSDSNVGQLLGIQGANPGDFNWERPEGVIDENSALRRLEPGGSGSFRIRFTPGGLGERSAEVLIRSGRSTWAPTFTVALKGVGVPAGVVAVSTKLVNFGEQAVWTRSTKRTVTFTNYGEKPFEIFRIELDAEHAGDFALAEPLGKVMRGAELVSSADSVFWTSPVSLNPEAGIGKGESCVMSISFMPSGNGVRHGAFNVVHNAGGTPTRIVMTGVGVS